MRATTSLMTAGIVLVVSLWSDDASAGRRKMPALPAPFASQPDASPGSVQERGYAEDAGGAIMDRLGFAVRVFAYGMRRYIADARAAAPVATVGVSQASLDVFARQIRIATFAYFEYTYMDQGAERTRIYVSRSNRGLDRFILRTTVDLAAPVQTEADYLPDSEMLRFVRDTAPVAGSSVAPTRVTATNRENDAEIKILQLLSSDIEANPAMAGGTLVAYVSQQPCESCSPAFRHFARETGASVRVNYVYGGREPARQTTLYRALQQAREMAVALLVAGFVTQAATPSLPR